MKEDEENMLRQHRSAIDQIDQELIRSLSKRFEISRDIAGYKRQANLPVVQPDRARDVEQRYVESGQQYGLGADFLANLFRLIHQESCRLQNELHDPEC